MATCADLLFLTGQTGGTEIPIHAGLSRALAEWRARAYTSEGDPVVRVPASITRLFHADRERAGIPYRDERGRTVDFHSLRHTFATWLRQHARVDPKLHQILMRHSAMATTLAYQHVHDEELRGAVDALPSVKVNRGEEYQPQFFLDFTVDDNATVK